MPISRASALISCRYQIITKGHGDFMPRIFSFLVFIAAINSSGNAFAAHELPVPAPYDTFAHSSMIDNMALSRMRGGFNFGPIGIDMDFISQISVENIAAGIATFEELNFTTNFTTAQNAQDAQEISQQIV